MTYPRYMFLTYGWYGDRLLTEGEQGDECTPAQREGVLQHTLAVIQEEFLTNLSVITDTGIVSCHFSGVYVHDSVLDSITSTIKKDAGQQLNINVDQV